MIKIDACGFSCPEPLVMLKKGLLESENITLLVDNQNSAESCSRYAKSKGFTVLITEINEVFELKIARKE